MVRFISAFLIILAVLQIGAQAQTKLNITVPSATIETSLSLGDALSQVNSSYNFVDKTDLETKFKEARYMLQKDDVYVAYNKDREVLEVGLFACY